MQPGFSLVCASVDYSNKPSAIRVRPDHTLSNHQLHAIIRYFNVVSSSNFIMERFWEVVIIRATIIQQLTPDYELAADTVSVYIASIYDSACHGSVST